MTSKERVDLITVISDIHGEEYDTIDPKIELKDTARYRMRV
jgi:hypothetical protein